MSYVSAKTTSMYENLKINQSNTDSKTIQNTQQSLEKKENKLLQSLTLSTTDVSKMGKSIANINISETNTNNNEITLATNVKGTTYYPDPNDSKTSMEGGIGAAFAPKADLREHTIEAYLKDPDKAKFVAIAIDAHLIRSGKISPEDEIRIPEIEKRLGKSPIIFKAIDTGSAFTGGKFVKDKFIPNKKYKPKGFSAIDICSNKGGKFNNFTFPEKLTLLKIQK
ncbi:MAG: hypothetical protein U0354_02115 [Candidatus Sericytochromatia bacterium]